MGERQLGAERSNQERDPSFPGREPGHLDLQHHRLLLCRLMDVRPQQGSWKRLFTSRVLTFHARTVPSRLQE